MTDDKLKPTQADIDAVKRFHAESARWMLDAIKSGDPIGEERDLNHPIYQAFARHRIAATDTQVSKHSELADRLEIACRNSEKARSKDHLAVEPFLAHIAYIVEADLPVILSALRQAPDAQVSSLVSACETACELMQEAKGFEGPNGGPITDHLDFADSTLRAALDGVGSKSA